MSVRRKGAITDMTTHGLGGCFVSERTLDVQTVTEGYILTGSHQNL